MVRVIKGNAKWKIHTLHSRSASLERSTVSTQAIKCDLTWACTLAILLNFQLLKVENHSLTWCLLRFSEELARPGLGSFLGTLHIKSVLDFLYQFTQRENDTDTVLEYFLCHTYTDIKFISLSFFFFPWGEQFIEKHFIVSLRSIFYPRGTFNRNIYLEKKFVKDLTFSLFEKVCISNCP